MDEKFWMRKKKLAKAALNRDAQILAADNVELSEEEGERFLRMTATGAISRQEFLDLIDAIRGPEPAQAYSEVEKSKFMQRILAYMTGVGFDNYERVKAENAAKFLEKYPNPADFESAKNDFLEAVRRSNPEPKYQEYVSAMADFERAIYGKKAEYSAVLRELLRDAEEWQENEEAKKLTAELMPAAQIEGDAWVQNGGEFTLTKEAIEKAGLLPRVAVKLDSVIVAISKVFMVDTHEAALGFVKYNDTVKVRGFYRSNSQGIWRYLPGYAGGNGEIIWYATGYSEESLNLPLKLQRALNNMVAKGIYEIPGVNTGFFLAGTTKRFSSRDEYKQLLADDKLEGDYYREVKAEPTVDFGVLSTLKHPPESIDVEGGRAPNFRREIDHYVVRTEMYGDVMFRQFPSMNEKLRYIICGVGEGDEKKAWIGSIEVDAPITSVGLRAEWVSTGDLCTPLYEYQTMTGGYGEPLAQVPGYESMWEKYLKQMPIIKRYLYTWRDGN